MKYTATKRTVSYGGSTYVVLDKAWGFKPGELVNITAERADDSGVGPEEGD